MSSPAPAQMPAGSPCGWPAPAPVCCPVWDTAAESVRSWAAGAAAGVLWALSGRRLGVCESSVRPAGPSCVRPSTWDGPVAGPGFAPALVAGSWINLWCGRPGCVAGCGCGPLTGLVLPGPVAAVSEVLVDGVPLDPAAYRVDDRRLLVRTDGGRWPAWQNLSAPAGDPDTFVVTYGRGVPLDAAAAAAYASYACELAKSCVGDKSCALPARVQSLTREGVSVAFVDPMEFLRDGRTGVPAVDVWLAAANPSSATGPPVVWSPDLPSTRATTWTAGG